MTICTCTARYRAKALVLGWAFITQQLGKTARIWVGAGCSTQQIKPIFRGFAWFYRSQLVYARRTPVRHLKPRRGWES